MRLRIALVTTVIAGLVVSIPATGLAQPDIRNMSVITGSADISQVTATRHYLAWAQTSARRPNQTNLFVKVRGEERRRVNPSGTEGTLGAIDGNRLVFQQFKGSVDDGNSSIRIVDLQSGHRRAPKAVNSRHWDFWPAIDGRWVLYGRTNPNANTTKVLLTNLKTGNTRTLDKARAATYFQPGQVSGKFAVWLRWKPRGKSKVIRYNMETGNTTRIPTGDRYNWAPSVDGDGVVFFGRSGANCGSRVTLHKWSNRKGATRLDRLADGMDVEDSFVTKNNAGEREVFYTRIDCDDDAAGDVFKLLFDEPDGPRPTPSPTPTQSPTPEGPTLEVVVEGDGTVTSDPDGIDCGSDCEDEFEEGTEITLTAVADQGSRIWDWDHPSCGRRDTTCTFEMGEDDLTVTVTFR